MVSDTLRISITFLIILLLLRQKLNIGYVMLIASCTLAVLYRMTLPLVFQTVRDALLEPITMELLLALSLIRIFELITRENNVLSDMMNGVRAFFKSRRAVIISMPLLIGMLPSLGGAYFSAPMVKDATVGLGMPPEEKAFVNYWFRHPWEYVLPLYPGILLASAISKIPLHTMIAANLTYALVLFGAGFIFSMRGLREKGLPEQDRPEKGKTASKAVKSFLPLIAVLFLVMAFHMELHYALLIVIVLLFFRYRYGIRDVPRFLRYGFTREVILLIFGVMLFKEILETSGAVHNLSVFFIQKGIPVAPVLCLLPFATGLLTGLTSAFVGSTFPLLISITGKASVSDMSLAFAAGYVGVLLSPLHLCLILTKEYFKADLRGVYRKIAPACGLIFLSAIAEYLIMR
jgi:integral membrane protein (TIGR00529 family)